MSPQSWRRLLQLAISWTMFRKEALAHVVFVAELEGKQKEPAGARWNILGKKHFMRKVFRKKAAYAHSDRRWCVTPVSRVVAMRGAHIFRFAPILVST